MAPPKAKPITDEDGNVFRLLRQLDLAPEASQRSIAEALGLSLGTLNTRLKSAEAAGFIKISDREFPRPQAGGIRSASCRTDGHRQRSRPHQTQD